MTFLLKWLGLGKPAPAVGLRPHRDVDLPLDYDAAFARVLSKIELTLGGNITIDDRRTGFLEVAFGLVNSERVRCTFERTDDSHTRVRIEAFFPAGAMIQTQSRAVDALADTLTSS
ncbi:MAG TPA: hypothetical protein VFE36_01470 [Candidatus Baltobacteraceae bacterium]|nr:hypothetical protein [Candidatus Baltobacteraceae bacterium]